MSIFEQRESEIRAYCRAYPAVFDTASNARIRDEEGNEYIDFFAGAGVLNYGHNNERMKRAVIAHIERDGLTHSLDLHTTAKRRFMERFTEVILEPRGMSHKMMFSGPTGTNAVEAALKMARRVTGRRQVVAFNHGFHGMTLGSLSCTGNQVFRNASGVPLEHVVHAPFGSVAGGEELGGGLQHLEQLRAQYNDTSSGMSPPAAFLVEPIQAEGGVMVGDKQWLQELQKLARETGALLIIDDIQVGCGRTGSFFSFDGYDLDPDIVCLAKGIGGMGTPLAMNLIKPEHDAHWNPGEHTGTFRGQGLSFVAGTEALSYFEDKELMSRVCEGEGIIRDKLSPLVEANPGFQLRGRGMIAGLDVGTGDLTKAILQECYKRGLMIVGCGSGGRVVKVMPPLTIDREDLEKGLDIVVEATRAVREAA